MSEILYGEVLDGVTDQRQGAIRNAGRERASELLKARASEKLAESLRAPCNKTDPHRGFGAGCPTVGEHHHCIECGACLPIYVPVSMTFGFSGEYDERGHRKRCPRGDKEYCSNACRQRAYRKRKKAGA